MTKNRVLGLKMPTPFPRQLLKTQRSFIKSTLNLSEKLNNVAFYLVNVTFFSFIRIMLETNNIANLFKQFFRRFFHGMIPRKIFAIRTFWISSTNIPNDS